MERVKEEAIIEAKTKTAEISVELKSRNHQVDALERKVQQQMSEIEQQKKLFGSGQGDAELLINLRVTSEKLSKTMDELEKLKRDSNRELNSLRLDLKDATKKKEAFEEELTLFQNQDRAIREKCTHLEIQNKKMDKTVTEQEYELVKLQKLEKEFLEERDKLLGQVHESSYKADKYYDELKKSREVNARMDHEIRELQKKLETSNPTIIKEQKELIIDLKQRVNVLERELNLINTQTAKEIEELRKQKEDLQRQLAGDVNDKEAFRQLEEMNIYKVRGMLAKSKSELEQASTQISQLKQELSIQQAYYEGELNKKPKQPEVQTHENLMGENKGDGDFSVTDKYTLLSRLEEKQRLINDLEGRLKANYMEKEGAIKLIKVLQDELKLQEKHFTNTTGTQATYYSKLAEKSVKDEQKITELMTKLSKDGGDLHKIRTTQLEAIRNASDIGHDQVRILQHELKK